METSLSRKDKESIKTGHLLLEFPFAKQGDRVTNKYKEREIKN